MKSLVLSALLIAVAGTAMAHVVDGPTTPAKALLAGAKAGKGASGKGAAGKSASKPAGGARKGSGRGDSAPPPAGKPRKRKAKS